MTLYLVVPCYNEEEGIEKSAGILKNYLRVLEEKKMIDSSSKIVFVNDGSSDRTKDIIEKLHREDPIFSVINFSRNYGHQYAVMAGYEFSTNKCDACISIDADLQQDIHAIEEFIQKYNEGNDIVYGVRNTRDTDGAFKRMTSQLFYKIMQVFGCNIIPNHADYRLLSNKVLQALSKFEESTVFLRGMLPSMGYTSTIVYFDVSDRTEGQSKYTLKKMMTLAGDGITSYSTVPVYYIFILGLLLLVSGAVGLIVTAVLAAFHYSIWILGLVFFGILMTGLVLTANGILGIYLVKCYMEVKKRPRYLIDTVYHETETSSVKKDL